MALQNAPRYGPALRHCPLPLREVAREPGPGAALRRFPGIISLLRCIVSPYDHPDLTVATYGDLFRGFSERFLEERAPKPDSRIVSKRRIGIL